MGLSSGLEIDTIIWRLKTQYIHIMTSEIFISSHTISFFNGMSYASKDRLSGLKIYFIFVRFSAKC